MVLAAGGEEMRSLASRKSVESFLYRWHLLATRIIQLDGPLVASSDKSGPDGTHGKFHIGDCPSLFQAHFPMASEM